MPIAIFPDSCAFLNKSEYLLCTKLRIVICNFKIISVEHGIITTVLSPIKKIIQGRLRTPLPDTVRCYS